MKQLILIMGLITLFYTVSGCEKILLGKIEENTVLNNFDVFGEEFQHRYGLFKVRNIDWSSMLQKYRPQLEAEPTEEKLYQVLTALIVDLDDSHVSLSHPTQQFKTFEGGIWGKLDRADYKDMDFDLIKKNYLTLIDSAEDERAYYGTVDGDIGYVHFPWIYDVPDFWQNYMPGMIDDLSTTIGLIIDIRNNDGGEDECSRIIAGYFASQQSHYMISRYKNGTGPDDFSSPMNWYVHPADGPRYLKPIVLLTNRYTISAAETFTLAMKTLPNVTHMGDTTSGAFSDAVSRQLPNGWQFSLSVGDYRDAANISHEGIGLIPQILIKNSTDDLDNGIDKVLEEAVQFLK